MRIVSILTQNVNFFFKIFHEDKNIDHPILFLNIDDKSIRINGVNFLNKRKHKSQSDRGWGGAQ